MAHRMENGLSATGILQSGLTSEEAARRLAGFGFNELAGPGRLSAPMLLLRQFKDLIILVLLGATVVSFVIGEIADAVTIVIIVILNAMLGFVQEYRTEKSMKALRELSAPSAQVMRDAREMMVPAKLVVPGDLLLLEAGTRVAADCVLVQSAAVSVDESLLTGESIPVEKEAVAGECSLSKQIDARHCLFMGTSLVTGRGRAIVRFTAMDTAMGRVAHLMQTVEKDETPLKKRLNRIGRILVFICLGTCILIAVGGILHGETPYDMLFSAISLAVAAIPEGLPTIVTVSLALGVQRMLKRNALVRKLSAVETLGSVDVICSDKTGTLTQNRMSVQRIFCAGRSFCLPRGKNALEGQFHSGESPAGPSYDPALKMLLTIGALCNNASLSPEGVRGDPTEAAIFAASIKEDEARRAAADHVREMEMPFDPDRRRMSVICRHRNGKFFLFVKGAPDSILPLCTRQLGDGPLSRMDASYRDSVSKVLSGMAGEALRVLAFAYAELPGLPPRMDPSILERDLVFAGLMGMLDPPRPEAVTAVARCREAGIRPVMITGDHVATASAVACQLGFEDDAGAVLTGEQLECFSDRELEKKVLLFSVFARVSPGHKLRIVRAFKRAGCFVAMTGDGVNDAPALKEAHIGISMGKNGTDVAREASSMVLLDDDFATIVAAVEEGRMIFDNIKKSLLYLLSCNLGEIFMMGIAACFGLPVPLIPIQILWINVVTDGLPALALGLDPPSADVMSRPPLSAGESIFSGGLGSRIFFSGILIGGASLLCFLALMLLPGGSLPLARTGGFATLIIAELIYAFECRVSSRVRLFSSLFTNRWLVLAVLASFALMLLVMAVPFLSSLFGLASLGLRGWLAVVGFSLLEPVVGGLIASIFTPQRRAQAAGRRSR
jgi:P-type Ca2+ transporter type 2C